MKINTREHILKTSKKLFNEFGIYNVTMRKIAFEMGMSQGNLNYHFKKKEDVIKELFDKAAKQLTDEIQDVTRLGMSYYLLFELIRKTLEINFEYKFLIADITFLVKDFKEIYNRYKLLRTERIGQINQIIRGLTDKGFVRQPEYKTEFEELALRMYILCTYPVLETGFEFLFDKEKFLKKYMSIIISTFYPYMTKEGKKKYFEILEDYMI
jgi:AcrR family transcriptional regulator